MIDIFIYTDPKPFLEDFYRAKKKDNRLFSFRMISRLLKIRSPSIFPQIVKGKTKISGKMLSKLICLMGLNEKEATYFGHIVHLNQARNEAERKYYFDEFSRFMCANIKIISPHQFEFYCKWYTPVIRAAVGYFRFGNDYRRLARHLSPQITALQAKKAIELLLKLKMIAKQPNGSYTILEPFISTGSVAGRMVLDGYHEQVAGLARDAITGTPRDLREISGLTLGISEEVYAEAKEELRKLRQKILQMAR